MKLLVTLLLLVTSLVSAASEGPVILIDFAHSQLDQPKGKDAPAYSIAASEQLRIDSRQLDFKKSSYPNARPNSVHVFIKSRKYIVAWNGSALMELTSKTMTPLNDTPRFSGFRQGDAVVILIGEQRTDPSTKEISLKAQWVGLVNVT